MTGFKQTNATLFEVSDETINGLLSGSFEQLASVVESQISESYDEIFEDAGESFRVLATFPTHVVAFSETGEFQKIAYYVSEKGDVFLGRSERLDVTVLSEGNARTELQSEAQGDDPVRIKALESLVDEAHTSAINTLEEMRHDNTSMWRSLFNGAVSEGDVVLEKAPKGFLEQMNVLNASLSLLQDEESVHEAARPFADAVAEELDVYLETVNQALATSDEAAKTAIQTEVASMFSVYQGAGRLVSMVGT